ncbi:MAG TPA: TetR family transcriptional regulator [Microbacterium sp.]|uniref:TetR/AcrR family transcriptional regulator n=1 Tax=Microbacterium sp. TaxID=51671 RepID=UPI000EED8977|nr:TetR family transcriptional regulator [Microbacterium sp.]
MSTRRGANDPGRRERIIDVTLALISEDGVHKTTHRRIAARADVPLGSLTYYFNSLADLFENAFASFSTRLSEQYRARLAAASDREQACEAVVALICDGSYATEGEVRTLLEMYSYGSHNTAVRDLCREWLNVSRESLGLHFSEPTARALDALIEGWPIHQTWEAAHVDRDVVRASVAAIVERFEPAPSR